MIPKHHDPTQCRPKRHAKAPYNFVQLPEAIAISDDPPRQDQYDPALLSGKFTCTLTTESPVYVRAARTLEEFNNNDRDGNSSPITPSLPFYGETEEILLIPGSSLRGMIRTMVEILSHGNLKPVTDHRLFYRTVDDTSAGKSYTKRMRDKVRGGFFHHDKYHSWIKPCQVFKVSHSLLNGLFPQGLYDGNGPNRTPKTTIQNKRVFISIPPDSSINNTRIMKIYQISLQPGTNLTEGTLVITGSMQNKEHEFVFVKSSFSENLDLDEEMVNRFLDDDQITRWQGLAFPQNRHRKKKGGLADGDPVFYLPSEDNKSIEFFGRAYMFRLPYLHSPKEMIPEKLNKYKGVDMAEAMFGMVSGGEYKINAIAGRVSFSDAIFIGDPENALLTDDPIYIKILSGPKPTAFQHYLTQRFPDHKKWLDHFDNDPNTETTLRGHKLYWHRGNVSQSDIEADPQHRQQFQSQYSPPVKPVKSNQKFVFEIQFENLREEELGALVWILEIAKQPKYCLKIGMGKPYGMGSVSIETTPCLINRNARYSDLISGDNWNEGFLSPEETVLIIKKSKDKFCNRLLGNPEINPTGLQNILDLPRIKDLLALLSWPGPNPELTDYMNLQEFAGRSGGYDSRPVLPSPQAVSNNQLPSTSPSPPQEPEPRMPTEPLFASHDVSASVDEVIKKLQSRENTLDTSSSILEVVNKPPSKLKNGDFINAKIYDIDTSGDIYLSPEISGDDDYCLIHAHERSGKKYEVDQTILVEVIKIQGDDENGWEIIVRPV